MTFPDVETNPQSPVNLTRQKRQLAEQAIAHASAAQWTESAATNRKLLELGPDAELFIREDAYVRKRDRVEWLGEVSPAGLARLYGEAAALILRAKAARLAMP